MEFFSNFSDPDFMELFWPQLIASSLIAVVISYIGIFLILRKTIFLGLGLTQISTLGLALAAFYELSEIPFKIFSLEIPAHFLVEIPVILLGIIFFSFLASREQHSKESLIAITYCAATGIAILLVAKSNQDSHILNSLKGNILEVNYDQINYLLGIIFVIGILHILFYKPFLITTFDPTYAKTLHFNLIIWDILLYSTMGLIISFTIHIAGSLMVFSLLIFPGILAIKKFRTLKFVFLFAVIFSLVSSVLGLILSLIYNLPPGPTIVATSFFLMLVFFLILPNQ